MEIIFLSKDIKEVKKNISIKKSIDEQAERFRQDMLAKHGFLFEKIPHIISIKYY